jgi:small subunit ribosomal protein S11
MAGFKGAQRGTLDAALAACQLLISKTTATGTKPGGVWLKLNGFGGGREGAVRALREAEWRVVRVQDTTGVPWGGDRPRKRKRR